MGRNERRKPREVKDFVTKVGDRGNNFASAETGTPSSTDGAGNTPTEPKPETLIVNDNTSTEPVSDTGKGVPSTESSDVTGTQSTVADNVDETSKINTSTESISETGTGNNATVNADDSSNSNTDTSDGNETVNGIQPTEHVDVISNSNTSTVTKDVILPSNTEPDNVSDEVKPTTVKDVTDDLLNMFNEKQNKLTVEETHIRATFLFNRELDKRLNKLAKGKRGFKTMFLNKAIESLLNEMERGQK